MQSCALSNALHIRELLLQGCWLWLAQDVYSEWNTWVGILKNLLWAARFLSLPTSLIRSRIHALKHRLQPTTALFMIALSLCNDEKSSSPCTKKTSIFPRQVSSFSTSRLLYALHLEDGCTNYFTSSALRFPFSMDEKGSTYCDGSPKRQTREQRGRKQLIKALWGKKDGFDSGWYWVTKNEKEHRILFIRVSRLLARTEWGLYGKLSVYLFIIDLIL